MLLAGRIRSAHAACSPRPSVRWTTQRGKCVRNVLNLSHFHVLRRQAPLEVAGSPCRLPSPIIVRVPSSMQKLASFIRYIRWFLRRGERQWPPADHTHLGLCTNTGAPPRVIYDVCNILRTGMCRAAIEKATHEVWTGVPCVGPRNPELRRPDGLSPNSVQNASKSV